MTVLASLATITILSNCGVNNAVISSSGAPFFLAYDSEDVILAPSEVATITSTTGLEIDGVKVDSKNFRSAHTRGFKGSVVVADILPGTHDVKVLNDPGGNPVRMDAITYDFEAGKVYNIIFKFLSIVIEENTSVEVANKIANNRMNNEFAAKKRTRNSSSQSSQSVSNSLSDRQSLVLGEWAIANYQEAEDFCANSGKDGYDNWRLPTLQEMDAIYFKVFSDAQSPVAWHWTSTARNKEDLWVKNVKNGKTGKAPQRKKITVRCVRNE